MSFFVYRFLCINIFLCFGFPVLAENYTDHSDRYALALVIAQPGFTFDVQPDGNSKKIIKYKPNLRAATGFAGSAYGFSASYLFKNNQTQSEKLSKGETSYDDVRLSTFLGSRKQWRVFAYYTRYSGFYIENSNYVDSSVGPGDSRVQRPDLKFRNGGFSVMHIVNSNEFSLSGATEFTHQQTESGGSWLIKLDLDHSTFSAREAIVPASVQADFGSDASLTRGDFNTLSISGGYGHSFVFRNFFLCPMGTFGLGLQQRNYVLNGKGESSIKNSRKLGVSGTLGYNGEKYFSAANFSLDQVQFATGSLDLTSSLESVRLTFGGRF